MGKKRDLSVFDAISALETEDVQAEGQRRKRSTRDAKRAKAVQSQSAVYNQLLECRILMQRALTSVNSAEGTSEAVDDTCGSLLSNLLQVRKSLATNSSAQDNDSDDDEDVVDYAELVNSADHGELNEMLQQEYDVCRDDWKEVLNRRHQEIKMRGGSSAKAQFKLVDSSFWSQIDSVREFGKLRDGGDSDDDKPQLDDSKLYQQLLKEFIMNSSSSTDSNVASKLKESRKQKQNSRKAKVDRKASKGRKVRYNEIPKLVNFTFPLSRPSVSNLDQGEWFQSLFGGIGNK